MEGKVGKERYHFKKVKAHRSRSAAEAEGAEAVMAWRGNEAVDILARGLARQLRQESTAQEPPTQASAFREAVIQLAVGTAWAIRQWPEIGQRRGRRPRRRAGSMNEAGPHTLVPRVGGGRECTRCRLFTRTATSLKSMRSKPCLSSAAQLYHGTHRLDWSRGVTWCRTCGAYSIRRPRLLRSKCPGRPSSEAARNVLRRLQEGLPPTTAAYLGEDRVVHHALGDQSATAAACPTDAPTQPPPASFTPGVKGRYTRLDAARAREGMNGESSLCEPCGINVQAFSASEQAQNETEHVSENSALSPNFFSTAIMRTTTLLLLSRL